MARVDSEEPYWANQAAEALRAERITVKITPALQESIDEEWTWAEYPASWLTRDEIREVSDDAQKLYDDIRTGRMTVHLHAHDDFTTVAVATHNAADASTVFLHGEDHLRGVTEVFETPAAGIAAFQKLYGPAVRPGPAPATRAERRAAEALKPLPTAVTSAALRRASKSRSAHSSTQPATIQDHEELLDAFLDANREWAKYRTWDDNCSYLNHESLTVRAELNHEAAPHEAAWRFAAYASPVGDLVWEASATTTAPTSLVRSLLENAAGHLAPPPHDPATLDDRVARATGALTEAGWHRETDINRWNTWTAPDRSYGLRLDTYAAAHPERPLQSWTAWCHATTDQPAWAIGLSADAPLDILRDLAVALAATPRAAEPRLAVSSVAPTPPGSNVGTPARRTTAGS